MTATVTGSNPTGMVCINNTQGNTLGCFTLSNGQATSNAPLYATMTPGSNTLNASYFGDSANNNSTGTVTYFVNGIAVTLSKSQVAPGEVVTLTAKVGGNNPTGTVSFKDGSSLIATAPLAGAQATFDATFTTGGQHSITATYSGDSNNSAAISPEKTLNVTKTSTTTALVLSPNPVSVGQPLTATVTVTGSNPTGIVCLNDELRNSWGCFGLPANGILTRTGPLYATQTAGNHSLRAYYPGDNNNKSSEITVPYTVANAPPSVALTAPANNMTFTAPASITLTATASDTNGTIAKVEFFNGATLLASVTQAPYSYAWNNVATGSYAITAVATDNLGATATSPVTAITVSGNAAPTISLSAPANNASFITPANITLTASASDADGTIAKVDFFNGDAFIGSTTSAPYSIPWPNVAAGSYQVKAVATDNQGGTATSETVNFQVAANTPATISLSAEASSGTVPGTINISAQASDTDGGVAKVEIFNGTSLLVTLFASPYDYQWTNVPAGSYTLTARVTDGVDDTTTSDPVPVTIAAGTTEEIYAIHADHLNTPRQITDSGNNVVWEWDNSDPFGNNVPVSNAGFEFNLRFPGQYFDKETNLHYNYFRDYDPEGGRYIQSDPIGLAGGINTYAYVEGNPLIYTDPLGLFSMADMPTLPQGMVDAVAGFGDALSFGATDWVRDQMGTNGSVNQCSDFYSGGKYAGYGWGLGLGGAGLARGAGWTVSFDRYANAGGGGLNILRNGARQFGLDWHKFKVNGQMVNRPHYHRGTTKSQMKKHRPWQGGY